MSPTRIPVRAIVTVETPTGIAFGDDVGFALLDRGKRYLAISPNLAQQNGASAQSHIGRTVREMLPGAADLIERYLDLARDSHEPVIDRGVIFVRASGEPRPALFTYAPIFAPGGEHLGWSAVVRSRPDDPAGAAAYYGVDATLRADEILRALGRIREIFEPGDVGSE